MKVDKVRHIEDCFDGSYIYEFQFTENVNTSFIHFLGASGKLTYFKNFARPFYKVVFEGDFYLKGVEGNNTARALLWSNENIETIRKITASYQEQLIEESN